MLNLTRLAYLLVIWCSLHVPMRGQLVPDLWLPGQELRPGQVTGLALFTFHGAKYYLFTPDNPMVLLYNLDHSVYKKIQLPAKAYGFTLRYLSDSLFDTDPDLEVLLSWREGARQLHGTFDHNGLPLQSWADCALQVDEEGSQAYLELRSLADSSLQRVLLPGRLLIRHPVLEGEVNTHFFSVLRAIPLEGSPTRYRITYKLPAKIRNGYLSLLDFNGQEVRRYEIDATFQDLLVDKDGLPPGVYRYRLLSSNGAILKETRIQLL